MAARKHSHGDSYIPESKANDQNAVPQIYCGNCRKYRSKPTWDVKHKNGECQTGKEKVEARTNPLDQECGPINHKRVPAGSNIGKVFCNKCCETWVLDGKDPENKMLICSVVHSFSKLVCIEVRQEDDELVEEEVTYAFCVFCSVSREIHRVKKQAKKRLRDDESEVEDEEDDVETVNKKNELFEAAKVLGISLKKAMRTSRVEKAFRKKASEHHPDKFMSSADSERKDENAEIFKKMVEAKEILLREWCKM